MHIEHRRVVVWKSGSGDSSCFKGHGHGVVQHMYQKIGGHGKLESVVPDNKWSEYDLYWTLSPKEVES